MEDMQAVAFILFTQHVCQAVLGTALQTPAENLFTMVSRMRQLLKRASKGCSAPGAGSGRE